MSAIEKTWVLSLCEMKLLIRNRQRLLGAVCLPIIIGAFFGLIAAQSTASGLLIALIISSLLVLQPGISRRMSESLSSASGRADLGRTAGILYCLLVLAVQTALYTGTAVLIEPGAQPGTVALIGAPALALLLSLLIRLR